MTNNRLKNLLNVVALSAVGVLLPSKLNAQEPKMGQYTNAHCKFINNKSEIVVDYTDTLVVHNIDTIIQYGEQYIACNVSKKGDDFIYQLNFQPGYYERPWLPLIQYGDTVAENMIIKDSEFVTKYYEYEKNGDEKRRDLIEQKLLANRQKLKKWSRQTAYQR